MLSDNYGKERLPTILPGDLAEQPYKDLTDEGYTRRCEFSGETPFALSLLILKELIAN